MKIEIGAYEAKTRLPELLRQVKAGKRFTITNRSEAMADLVPSESVQPKNKPAERAYALKVLAAIKQAQTGALVPVTSGRCKRGFP